MENKENNFEKEKIRRSTPSDFQVYDKAKDIKTMMQYWSKINIWINGIDQSPETDSLIYGQLILAKGVKVIQWKTKEVEIIEHLCTNKQTKPFISYVTPYTKINPN